MAFCRRRRSRQRRALQRASPVTQPCDVRRRLERARRSRAHRTTASVAGIDTYLLRFSLPTATPAARLGFLSISIASRPSILILGPVVVGHAQSILVHRIIRRVMSCAPAPSPSVAPLADANEQCASEDFSASVVRCSTQPRCLGKPAPTRFTSAVRLAGPTSLGSAAARRGPRLKHGGLRGALHPSGLGRRDRSADYAGQAHHTAHGGVPHPPAVDVPVQPTRSRAGGCEAEEAQPHPARRAARADGGDLQARRSLGREPSGVRVSPLAPPDTGRAHLGEGVPRRVGVPRSEGGDPRHRERPVPGKLPPDVLRAPAVTHGGSVRQSEHIHQTRHHRLGERQARSPRVLLPILPVLQQRRVHEQDVPRAAAQGVQALQEPAQRRAGRQRVSRRVRVTVRGR